MPRTTKSRYICYAVVGLLGTAGLAAAIVWLDLRPSPASIATTHMVVTADTYASSAGRQILRAGGSAVDAAIAAHLVLSLVEPQSAGIGGGLYMLVLDGAGQLKGYDGREVAPASASPTMFLDASGKPRPFSEIATGGLAVGVPGAIATLWKAHQQHGKLPWSALFKPAISLATNGFTISSLLADDINDLDFDKLPPNLRTMYFGTDGSARKAGETLRDPDYAASLRLIAKLGPGGFYEGPIADAIVTEVNRSAPNGGFMTLLDLKNYQAKEVTPICRHYRQYRLCSLPPSTSGGVTVLQILGLLEQFPRERLLPGSASGAHLLTQAERLAYADRRRWLGDPDFVTVPTQGLLSSAYLRQRARLIRDNRDMGNASAGTPPSSGARLNFSPQRSPARRGTSHLSVVDRSGQVVSMTMSIQAGFGAQLRSAGFMLNNELTDFSIEPMIDGNPVANAPAAGKRPLSAMGPFILFRPDGKFYAAIGSPGGEDIIAYNAQALSALVDGQASMPQAVSLPHVMNANGMTVLERRPSHAWTALKLWARGHTIRFRELRSGLNGIRRVGTTLEGASDPRGVGLALGD